MKGKYKYLRLKLMPEQGMAPVASALLTAPTGYQFHTARRKRGNVTITYIRVEK